jgi:hypothetical protein
MAVDFSDGLIVQPEILHAGFFGPATHLPGAAWPPNQPSLLSLHCALML